MLITVYEIKTVVNMAEKPSGTNNCLFLFMIGGEAKGGVGGVNIKSMKSRSDLSLVRDLSLAQA